MLLLVYKVELSMAACQLASFQLDEEQVLAEERTVTLFWCYWVGHCAQQPWDVRTSS